MATVTCQHGMSEAGCSYCRRSKVIARGGVVAAQPTARSRQRLLDDLCDLLDVARHAETPGSNPFRVFTAAAEKAKVSAPTMPGIGAAIAKKAGLEWGPGCDDRSYRHDATRVTGEGISVVHESLLILDARKSKRAAKPTS